MQRTERDMLRVMPDKTEKYYNPFVSAEVWYVPGRNNRPYSQVDFLSTAKLSVVKPENYCDFCEAHYFRTTPEKARLICTDLGYVYQQNLPPEQISKSAEFRRFSNLFEILSLEYWRKNYNFRLSKNVLQKKEAYLSSKVGRNHVIAMIDLKLKYSGYTAQEIRTISADDKYSMADAFFGGCHDLVISRRHYAYGAEFESQLCSSGELSPEQHYQYVRFTIQGMQEIFHGNRHVRYISVYQNWQRAAGATFEHLHKQLVGLDEWGGHLRHASEMVKKNIHVYNDHVVNIAARLVIAENDHAIAFVDVGHHFPTVAIFSKSEFCHPWEHPPESMRGFSDLLHGVHAALGVQRSCNEEWYYMPPESVVPIPWHIYLKWRANIHAGFEGATQLYIVPISVFQFRDILVHCLYELRKQQKIASFQIAAECHVRPNSLLYEKTGTR